MVRSPKHGANVILESADGITLQLRDDLFLWGIFGGLMEDGEDPEHTAIREIEEELTIILDPERLSLLRVFEGPDYTSHLYHYRLEGEMDDAVLTEGVRYEAKTQGDLIPEEVVPWHWEMLSWYWQSRG